MLIENLEIIVFQTSNVRGHLQNVYDDAVSGKTCIPRNGIPHNTNKKFGVLQ